MSTQDLGQYSSAVRQNGIRLGVNEPLVVTGTTGVLVGTAGVYSGAGAPSFTAPQGSIYLNTTGSSTSTRAYINTTGSTTWTAITTVA